jgi:hypothetical protein
MSVIGLTLSLGIAAVLIGWLVLPLIQRQSDTIDVLTAEARQRERLTVYYDRVLRNIHDLDEDYATGKLNPEQYRADREEWVYRGTQVLRALDELDTQHLIAPAQADPAAIDEMIDHSVEDAVARHRNQLET